MSEQEILDIIGGVKHPAIDHSLVDLGLVKNIKIMDKTVGLEFCFPFANIPIAEQLIRSIEVPLEKKGLLAVYKVTTMNEEEKARFMQMEKEAWTGLD